MTAWVWREGVEGQPRSAAAPGEQPRGQQGHRVMAACGCADALTLPVSLGRPQAQAALQVPVAWGGPCFLTWVCSPICPRAWESSHLLTVDPGTGEPGAQSWGPILWRQLNPIPFTQEGTHSFWTAVFVALPTPPHPNHSQQDPRVPRPWPHPSVLCLVLTGHHPAQGLSSTELVCC